MEDIPYYRDMYEPLETEGQKQEAKTDTGWNILKRKAVGQI